jgi:pyridoxal phosphate enzyme (YggS family)
MAPNDGNTIAANLARVRETIAETALRVGRKPTEIKLIAVSKTQPTPVLAAAITAGQLVFGENTVQEALPKIDALRDRGLEWHFIGHLQSNKAKFIPENFHWVHSLDSVKLAQRLSEAALERHVVIQTLIEVNITRDPKKHGVTPEALPTLVEQLVKAELPGLALRGLMTIGPHPANEAQSRRAFAALRSLRDAYQAHFSLSGFTELSMGMSDDYVPAILEGATMVRLGNAIFAGRDYPK